MLSSVRENLKGTLVVVVVIIFIVPMVISGVGSDFLGSAAGTDAAKVNGESITKAEVDRAIRIQRNSLLQQSGMDASNPYLSEENLRGPVLDRLSRRVALVTSGKDAGMGFSDDEYLKVLGQQKEFITDGKFDKQKFRTLLAQAQFTSAKYRQEIANDMIVNQQALGLQVSSFATQAEFAQIIKLMYQKRSFYAVKVPREAVQSDIVVSEEELLAAYESSKSSYEVPEKVQIEYLEVSIDQLAEKVVVGDADVIAQYEAEVANFTSDAQYSVAHILVEDSSVEKITEIQSKLDGGETFAALAESYSDDIATNMNGGDLGILTPAMFPSEFEEAVYTMEEGQVSSAVKTDIGTHFIKVLKKSVVEKPTLDSRRQQITQALARAAAQEEFALSVDTLGELTFSSDGLSEAATALGLTVNTSSYFDRNTGSGIANNDSIRVASFDEEVLVNGHNSNIIEMGPERTIVLRVKDKKASYIKPLSEVKVLVEADVKASKIQDALSVLVAAFESEVVAGADAKELAEKTNYSYEEFDLVKRSDITTNPEVGSFVFSAAKPEEGKPVSVKQASSDGGFWFASISEVIDGQVTDMEDAEKQGFLAQLTSQSAEFEGAIYEALVVEESEIDIY